jgi:hypothetical protein
LRLPLHRAADGCEDKQKTFHVNIV